LTKEFWLKTLIEYIKMGMEKREIDHFAGTLWIHMFEQWLKQAP
jgi:hypothetical protein